ncbi:MAG: hypothetical protein LBR17_01325, partial [Bacteroidales bacterium]|nr:hypothetical protein [Bacteroidales bacterium]
MSGNTGSIELLFDSSTNIYIKDTFYIVIDVPEDPLYGSECMAVWAMTTSVIKVPTGKNYCYCCEKMAPLVKYDNQWSHLTDYYFNLDTTTN